MFIFYMFMFYMFIFYMYIFYMFIIYMFIFYMFIFICLYLYVYILYVLYFMCLIRCKVHITQGLKHIIRFLISNFSRVLNALCFLLGNSPASELYMPTFRNTLFHLHRQVGTYMPIKMEQTECSETSAYTIQTPGNYPEESIQHVIRFHRHA